MCGWQKGLILKCFLFLQISRLGIAGCRYDIYPPQGPGDRCDDPTTRVASYTVEQHVCTILGDLPYGFFYMVVPLSSEDKYYRAAFEQLKGRPGMLINLVRPYNPKADDPCDFSSAGISHEFNSCFWWNMAQYHYTQFGLTCLNDTNVYDTAIPSSMAQSLSFSATTTFSSTAVPTSGFYTTGTTPSVVQASNSPTATDSPDKESIGLQKQGNKIGLAVGLCVGVPALLLALVQIRIHIRHTQASEPPSIPLSPGTQSQQGSSVPPGSTSANGNHQTQASLTPQQPQQNGLLLQQQTPAAVQTQRA